jgi:benzoyl-CoA reductase/2-hydroxyglutaryl-CoA dehydratase subunit BcrC/BadD/HgdB
MTWNLKIPLRSEAMAEQRARGGSVAAVFPIHYPRALFAALDALPVEVWGPASAGKSSDAHLPSYTCDIVKKGLSFILGGGLDSVDLIVVPHDCDSLQGLGTILKDFIPNTKPVLPLYTPRGRGKANMEYFARELKSFSASAASILGTTVDEQKLSLAIDEEEHATRGMANLWQRRPSLPAANREIFTLLRSREFLPAAKFSDLVEQALKLKSEKSSDKVPILLSGVVPEPMDLLDLLDSLGATIVADDFISTGRRIYKPSKNPDPWIRMAEYIIFGPPDSTRGSSFEERVSHLTDLAQKSGAKGAIFLVVKFCEPEQFYLPALKKKLEDEGIPTLVLEAGLGDPLSNHMITRIEAFMETFP